MALYLRQSATAIQNVLGTPFTTKSGAVQRTKADTLFVRTRFDSCDKSPSRSELLWATILGALPLFETQQRMLACTDPAKR